MVPKKPARAKKKLQMAFQKSSKGKKGHKSAAREYRGRKSVETNQALRLQKTGETKRNFVLKAGLLNAEGIDRPGKREEMGRKWEEAKLDIIFMPETQHNSRGCAQIPNLGKLYCDL